MSDVLRPNDRIFQDRAPAPTLRAEGLRKSYRDRRVVDDVDIEVQPGEIVGLLGPNGAGKTTSFYMIVGLIKPDEGRVFIGGEDLTGMPVYRRSRRGIGYLPQETSVFRNLTVRENLELVCEEMQRSAEHRFRPKESKALIDDLMEHFGISHLADTKGYALSGGERRRVEIARSMPLRPDFILLDEPFSGIDPIAVSDIQGMVQTLKTQGFGVLITDHNVRETLSITDRTYLIHDGRIILNGTPAEMMTNPLARKFYLGDDFSW
ncbi:MAG: LPS export ABC transporter ATP-binding protein [Synergistaceae bacterium]|jgi:lipopolysaccharide export system ATP-binding protein|nr:LPS export ABC transporter ATP-binding protein [Synergistaceae bacterium]